MGQTILGVVEGALTGENIGADMEGRSEAIHGLTDALHASPRFIVIDPGNVEADESLFDTEMPWPAAKKICRQSGCEGIVSLEAFDSDSSVDVSSSTRTETVDGKEKKVKEYSATQNTRVLAAWRLYDVENKRIIDEIRDTPTHETWSTSGTTEDSARSQLPSQTVAVKEVGHASGTAYGRRIAPSYSTVTRRYFGGGFFGIHPELKKAKELAKAGKWKQAEEAWRKIAKQTDSAKIKARATYGIAVSRELEGDLPDALTWAQKAAKTHNKGRIGRYPSILQARITDQKKVEEQMQ